MIFQKILKGIAGISEADARQMFAAAGIRCNWWRNNDPKPLPYDQIPDRLTPANLFGHLSNYKVFGPDSPFISTSAGGVERDAANGVNLRFPAFITALAFATRNFTTSGAIFYGYVNVLGRKSLKLPEFAEETRELNIWTDYQPYHRQGEIVAKIVIPPSHLEKAEIYDGPTALQELKSRRLPTPKVVHNHARYVPPEDVCNIREVIEEQP